MKKIFLVLLFLILFVVFYFSFVKHESHSYEEVVLTLDESYLAAIRSFASKETLEKIVDSSGGEVSSKEWQSFVLDVPKRIIRLREYKLDGELDFVVTKSDKSLGNLSLNFKQLVHVDKDLFLVKTSLSSPHKNVVVYNKVINIVPIPNVANKCELTLKSELKVVKSIPFFFCHLMDEKVSVANKRDVANLRSNITELSRKRVEIKMSER